MVIIKSTNGTFKRVLATTLIAACCAGGAMTVSAAPQSDQFSDIDCAKEQESMLGMKVCAGRELAKTEKELKAQRQKMLKAADKDMRKSMNKWFKAGDVPRWPPKFPRLWPPQTPPPELIGDRG